MEKVLINRNYKNEMVKYEKQREREEFMRLYNNGLTDRDIEYRDFVCWLLEQAKFNNQLVIVKDEEIPTKIIDSDKFFGEFEKITGIGIKEFEKCFVSGYIEEWGNRANLIVKVNGVNCKYIIDVVCGFVWR